MTESTTTADWIEPFDHDDYAFADGFYARQRLRQAQPPASPSRARQVRDAKKGLSR